VNKFFFSEPCIPRKVPLRKVWRTSLWSLDSVPLPVLLVIKPKIVQQSSKWRVQMLSYINHTDKPNWQANWTYNAITSLLLNGTFFRKTDLDETANMNWLLGQVFVAVKKWESCIYFQRKLHLCAVSCIYAQIWLRKTWHNLFSFARKVRFSALPPLIEFGHCRLGL